MKVKRPTYPDETSEWRQHLNRRLRAEFITGTDEEWRKRYGRPMTAAELALMLRRYPGDV